MRGTRKEGESENTRKGGGVIAEGHPDDRKWGLKGLEAGRTLSLGRWEKWDASVNGYEGGVGSW